MAKKAAKTAAKKPEEVLVVASKVRAYIRSKDAMVSGELLEALNCKMYCILDQAIERAKENKRSTVRKQDV